MASVSRSNTVPPDLCRLLDAVRRRLRAYVWVEGLAIVVVLLSAAFWLGLALDWSFEPSSSIRRVALVVVGGATLWACYRYLLRRAFTPIADSSLALLLERRFP
ncbi:MAG TPA: polyketide synthase, partial [Lacipirellulaceae bacterium]|nr:polyketide synthase [Lacipirellulaceae bacterium]